MSIILNGLEIATTIRHELKIKTENYIKKFHSHPGLAIIQIGNNEASNLYIANKIKSCDMIGIHHYYYQLPDKISEDLLLSKIQSLNNDDNIHGIIVQLPTPLHISYKKLINAISPEKDVDGFHPINVGNLAIGHDGFIPCTPQGCLALIKTELKDLSGKHAVIIGRSNLVGKPMSLLLLRENCTISIIHSHTVNPINLCKMADIVIVATGSKHLVNSNWLKKKAFVIDVGINITKTNNEVEIHGDVDFEDAKNVTSAISPVPGGVGPLTVAFLMRNILLSACKKKHIEFDDL